MDYWCHILPSLLPEPFVTIPLHGKHPPNVRQKNFTRFTNSVTPSVLLTTDVAARGLDIPLVDLVIQIDPPTDPKAYLHRCGRAGRAGRRGLSVILLSPGREEDYIPFLEVRKTPVCPLESPSITTSDTSATQTTNKIRQIVLRDRALHDKAQRAFVSWVRSYTKHQASSIFRIADMDWEDVGRAWGLLRLPKMPELQKFTGDKSLGVNFDWSNYSYKDKQREAHRQEVLKAAAANPPSQANNKKRPAPSSDANDPAPWSKNLEKKSDKERRRERKRSKKEREQWEKMTDEEKARVRETQEMVENLRKKNEQMLREMKEDTNNSSGAKANGTGMQVDGNGDESEFEGFD